MQSTDGKYEGEVRFYLENSNDSKVLSTNGDISGLVPVYLLAVSPDFLSSLENSVDDLGCWNLNAMGEGGNEG